jgi:hypothetical protein
MTPTPTQTLGDWNNLEWAISYNDTFSDEVKETMLRATSRWSEVILNTRTIQLDVSYMPDQDSAPFGGLAYASMNAVDGIEYLPVRGSIYIDPDDLDGSGANLNSTDLEDMIPIYETELQPVVDINGVETGEFEVVETLIGQETKLYYTLLHEIGHVLGIGPLWNWPLESDSAPSNIADSRKLMFNGDTGELIDIWSPDRYNITNPVYKGEKGVAGYNHYFFTDWDEDTSWLDDDSVGTPTTPVDCFPIEDSGGAGTAQSHPEEEDEDTPRYCQGILTPGLEEEIMTGYIDPYQHMPISRITIGMLEDLGWSVNYDAADYWNPADDSWEDLPEDPGEPSLPIP